MTDIVIPDDPFFFFKLMDSPAEYEAVCVECGSDEIEQLDRCDVYGSPVSVCGGCE